MNTEERERLRVVMLQSLRSVGDIGMIEPQILNGVRTAGFDATLPELQVELRALCDANLTAAMRPLGGKRYIITELGLAKLASAGL